MKMEGKSGQFNAARSCRDCHFGTEPVGVGSTLAPLMLLKCFFHGARRIGMEERMLPENRNMIARMAFVAAALTLCLACATPELAAIDEDDLLPEIGRAHV